MYKVIGFKVLDYKNKQGKQVKGVILYVYELDSNKPNCSGICPEQIYISWADLEKMYFSTYIEAELVDSNVHIYFNRYGKVVSIEIED